MSHTPPLPEAATSPYPLQEPPHPHDVAAVSAALPGGAGNDDRLTMGEAVRALLPIGTVVAVGAALVGGAAYLFAGRRGGKTTRRRGKKA